LLKTVFIVLLVTLYVLASHFALILPQGQAIAAALAISIPAAVAVGALYKWFGTQLASWAAQPEPAIVHQAVALCAAVLLAALVLLWAWPYVLSNADTLYFAQHLGTNALLAWVFGHTLRAGQTPLVVRFARMVHRQQVPAEIEQYARRVTVAWTLFFIATCLLSIVLFFAAPLAVWSSFAVLFQWPSVVAFFIGEYALRRLLFRNFKHASLKQGFDAYRQNQNVPPVGSKPHA
jgi:uncharacterized membrane protein